MQIDLDDTSRQAPMHHLLGDIQYILHVLRNLRNQHAQAHRSIAHNERHTYGCYALSGDAYRYEKIPYAVLKRILRNFQ